jgi:exodeoxyribonuclease V beta subunit
MNSLNPLDPLTLPLTGTNLIEASAGTGKTYTIAALYVRLILGHDIANPLSPKEILVVTFTDAATEELRDRIRNRLSESAQYFRNQISTQDKFLIELRKDYQTKNLNLNMCARNLEVAANYMDEAAVFTIHSWCNKMLQQHAFDSGSPFKQNVNTDDAELLNNVIRDYWRVHFYGLDKEKCEFIVKKVAKTPDDFAEKIKKLLGENEAEALNLNNFTMKFSDIFEKNDIKTAWKKEQTEITELLSTAIDKKWLSADKSKKAFPKSDSLQWIQDINDWLDNQKECNIDALEKFTISRFKTHLHDKPEKQDRIEQFLKFPFFSLIENQNSVKQIKLHAIQWIRNRYAEEKKKISRVTFDDMLNNLDKALQNKKSSLGEVICTQYPVALIDEFQDTDPIQYRIFSNIYQNQPSTSCFLIGDPKQAIYSFRGADIYTYLKAHQVTEEKNRYTLETNFRSTESFVGAVNQLFDQDKENPKGAFYFKDGVNNLLPFYPVNPKGLDNDFCINNKISPALTFWAWQEEKILMPTFRERMAAITASEIVKLLNNEKTGFKGEKFEKLELKDIAILVRGRTEAKIIRQELNRRNLKSVYLSEQDSIYDTDEASDILIWLNAIANPRDEGKVRAAVSTGTLNFDKADLYALTLDDDQWVKHLDRFQEYQTRWQKSGILPALRLLIHEYGLHLSRNNDNEIERRLTNVLHLAELLQRHSTKIEGEESLIHHFSQLLESKNLRSGNDNLIRLESDSNLIKIITIHKSKGLEYPLVFLPFVSNARKITAKENYFKYHNKKKELCIDLDKTNEGQTGQIEEQLQEDLRLLYVAVTRAKHACWIGVASIDRLKDSAIGHLLDWKEDKKDKEDDPANQLTDNLKKIKGGCTDIEILALPDPTNDKFSFQTENDSKGSVKTSTVDTRETWWTASYSKLEIDYKNKRGEIPTIETHEDDEELPEMETYEDNKLESYEDNDDDDTESLVEALENLGVHGLPKGAKPGVLIHTLLEKCGDYGFKKAHSDQEQEWRKKTIKEIFTGKSWDDEKRKILEDTLPKWLEIPLIENKNEKVRFIDLEKSNYKSELEFLIGANSVDVKKLDGLVAEATLNNELRPGLKKNEFNGFLKGFVDLIFCYDNKYYVVDYKSNYLGNSDADYSEEKMKDTMLKSRYDVQYSLYLLALHRLLEARLGKDYDYDKYFGGAIYVFLRGDNAKISDRPSLDFIKELDALFTGEK